MKRRKFLETSGLAIGGLGLGLRTLSASEFGGQPVDLIPNGMASDPRLKNLALVALDAAKRAGASYADIRIAQTYTLRIGLQSTGIPQFTIGSNILYGIRTLVDGAASFRGGHVATSDAVSQAANNAVLQARGFAKIVSKKTELAPAPVVTGEWATQYEIDPFSVPILEQGHMLASLGDYANRVEGATQTASFYWKRDNLIAATSEGSLTTQTFMRHNLNMYVSAGWISGVFIPVPHLRPRQAGYEVVANPALPEKLKQFDEEVKRYTMYPVRDIDVGRYPIVLDGYATAVVLADTIGRALQMDRVMGFESEASGTSFLSPAQDMLGTQLFSPHLNVTAGRIKGEVNDMKWDAECVDVKPYPIIQGGKVVDYITDRQTAMELSGWYKAQGLPAHSGGFAMSSKASDPLLVGPADLTMAPSSSGQSVDDLCRDMKRGILMMRPQDIAIDQQLSAGMMDSEDSCIMFEVRNGKIVSRVKGAGLMFKTVPFWKGLSAVGGASTIDIMRMNSYKGQPMQILECGASAPACRFSSVDVVSYGRGR